MKLRALVTSGPTHEPIDPVRFLSNPSSGKQGHAIASALARHGFEVTLITGPTILPEPTGMQRIAHVKTAHAMYHAALDSLPVDVAICAAAVGDWCLQNPFDEKLKKQPNQETLTLTFSRTPDILAALSQHISHRPKLVIGFAAETTRVIEQAEEKRRAKKCDWIIANHVNGQIPAFGADDNEVWLLSDHGVDAWPRQNKNAIAEQLAVQIIRHLSNA